MLKKVHMTLRSVQYDPPEEPMLPLSKPKESKPVHTVQNVVARYRETDDEVSLSYDEPDEGAEGKTQVQLFFSKSDPKTVTLARSGMQQYALVFREGGRCVSEYVVAGMGMEMTVATRRLQNTLAQDGCLHLEYTLELQGCNNGKRIIDIRIQPHIDTLREY